ncbi:DUF502 domain-containing protein [bacterium]|nr:DUF502 domain-containing protein [bacterium]MBU1072743.1 DUF502 domain-containing protein [bacterium]MBU1677065.1 DUF502 domain-containing protein [bacterium]
MGSWLRTRFVAGLLVTVPLIITFLILRLLYRNLNGLLGPWLDRLLGWHVPGLGLLATAMLVLLMGLLAANFAGKRLIVLGEGILSRMPLVRAVYRTTKEIVAAVALPKGQGLREPVMIEYPRSGLWSYGFVTAYIEREAAGGIESLANVYLPSPPMPTSGALVAVRLDDLYYLDMSNEQAMKLIVSGGMVAPPRLTARSSVTKNDD